MTEGDCLTLGSSLFDSKKIVGVETRSEFFCSYPYLPYSRLILKTVATVSFMQWWNRVPGVIRGRVVDEFIAKNKTSTPSSRAQRFPSKLVVQSFPRCSSPSSCQY